MKHPPKGNTPGRTVRISDKVWTKARRRARYEGHTMSEVMSTFVEGYGDNLIAMPIIKAVYRDQETPSA